MKDIFSKETTEWLIDIWLRLHGNRLARNAGYLVFAAAALVSNVGQYALSGLFSYFDIHVQILEVPTWISAFFVTIAAILLIVDRCIPPRRPPPNRHDVQLYDQFKQLISDDLKLFLDEHSFGDDWVRSRLAGLETFIYTWRGTRFEFQDRKLNESLHAVMDLANSLGIRIAEHSAMADYNLSFQTFKTRDDRQRGMSKETYAHVKEVNDLATRLIVAINKLDSLAREKLG